MTDRHLSVIDFSSADDAMRDIYVQNAHATLDRLIHLAGNDWHRFLHDFTSLNFKGNVVQIGSDRKGKGDGRAWCLRLHDVVREPLEATG